MQRPSAEKLWQHPAMEEDVLPIIPGLEPRRTPLEVQACIVFGRVRQDGQFLQNVHLTLRRAAAMAGSRLIDMVDEPHHVSGYGASAQQGNQQSDSSHGSYLRIKLMFYFAL